MGAQDLSEIAAIVTIVGVLAAIVSAAIAYRGWRYRTRHWLYIPAPRVHVQDPGNPDFWVFPPVEIEEDVYGLVIAGKLINAGPSDAFSIHVYADPGLEWELGIGLLEDAAEFAARHENCHADRESIRLAFLDAYKDRGAFIPVLRVGQERRFVVVGSLKKGDTYLEELLTISNDWISRHWETEDRRQAHGIHAASRTILGRRVVFGPDDLCAPFEVTRGASGSLAALTRRGSSRW